MHCASEDLAELHELLDMLNVSLSGAISLDEVEEIEDEISCVIARIRQCEGN